nr:quinolinate synthase NadA [Angustibacter aerolatus]
MLGHHYQRDEVIEFTDVTGDSFRLAQQAAARPEAPYVVFCGVHFMAESADVLTGDHQQVVLPDLAAGCSMADMAAISQVEDAWDDLVDAGVADDVVPVSYMNSTAAIKAFTGRHGGTICTSSNAKVALEWAFAQRPAGRAKVLFLPDQHLGRNTAVRDLGLSLDDCVLYDPHKPLGGLTRQQPGRRPGDPLAGALQRARPVHAGRRRRRPLAGAGRAGDGAPRVPARGRAGRRRGGLDRAHHQGARGGAGRVVVGARHRA